VVFPRQTSATISYPIWLASTLKETKVHYIKKGGTDPAGCTGGSVTAPTAESGNLCIYAGFEELSNAELFGAGIEKANGENGSDRAGAEVVFVVHEIEQPAAIRVQGTWAVTG
jgi:hypothetical protein